MDDDPFTEEEQRFNDMLDGIGDEYDKLITEQAARHHKKQTREIFIMLMMIVVAIAIVAWAVMGFPEFWR